MSARRSARAGRDPSCSGFVAGWAARTHTSYPCRFARARGHRVLRVRRESSPLGRDGVRGTPQPRGRAEDARREQRRGSRARAARNLSFFGWQDLVGRAKWRARRIRTTARDTSKKVRRGLLQSLSCAEPKAEAKQPNRTRRFAKATQQTTATALGSVAVAGGLCGGWSRENRRGQALTVQGTKVRETPWVVFRPVMQTAISKSR